MAGSGRNKKDRQLYYMLPSMGRANRRRYYQVLRWSLVIGIIVSVMVGFLIYLVHRSY